MENFPNSRTRYNGGWVVINFMVSLSSVYSTIYSPFLSRSLCSGVNM